MEKIVSFSDNLDMFEKFVLLYKNDKGDTYLASSSNDESGKENRKNRIVLYKDALPKDQDYISGWNYLDDNSEKIYIVYNEHSEVAVDDFLVANHVDKSWKDLDYNVFNSVSEINHQLTTDNLKNNEVRAYVTLKK